MRIDGLLHEVFKIDHDTFTNIASQIKYQSKMRVNVSNVPQDGRFSFTVNKRKIDVRVSALPTEYGESFVFRLLDSSKKLLSFEELGFSGPYLDKVIKLTELSHGMILVTGPTGSGKTTTLYTMLSKFNQPEVKIITLEDPIEYHLPGINQSQIDEKHGYDFASGLRSILRQDPEVIMIGEIRDLETASIAINASLTGHLVFSTLHTNDAASAITRLLELGVQPYLVNATVLGVLAQRLVRTLCKQCRRPDDSAETRAALDAMARPWKITGTCQSYRAVGCVDCRMTGFLGRMGLYELLTVSQELKEKATQSPDLESLRRQAIADGMRPLRLAGALRVAEGLTTVEEVLSATPAAD